MLLNGDEGVTVDRARLIHSKVQQGLMQAALQDSVVQYQCASSTDSERSESQPELIKGKAGIKIALKTCTAPTLAWERSHNFSRCLQIRRQNGCWVRSQKFDVSSCMRITMTAQIQQYGQFKTHGVCSCSMPANAAVRSASEGT